MSFDLILRRRIMASLVVGALALPAVARGADACQGAAPALPSELASWKTPVPVAAAGNQDSIARATLLVGQAASLHLLATPSVTFVHAPREAGGAGSSGGMAGFTVSSAGTYRVALGARAWIEIVGHAAAVESTAHQRGPACSGVGKMVDFPLVPGRYVLEISGGSNPVIPVLVARLK